MFDYNIMLYLRTNVSSFNQRSIKAMFDDNMNVIIKGMCDQCILEINCLIILQRA